MNISADGTLVSVDVSLFSLIFIRYYFEILRFMWIARCRSHYVPGRFSEEITY